MLQGHNPSASVQSLDGQLQSATRSDLRLDQPTLKIKIFKTDNVIALRVPAELPFNEIYERISTRLGVARPLLFDNPSFMGQPVDNATGFARVLKGETKVSLYLKS